MLLLGGLHGGGQGLRQARRCEAAQAGRLLPDGCRCCCRSGPLREACTMLRKNARR